MKKMTGAEIAQIRDDLELTTTEFAFKMFTTASTIYNWIRGKSRPSLIALQRLHSLRLLANRMKEIRRAQEQGNHAEAERLRHLSDENAERPEGVRSEDRPGTPSD